MLNGALAMAVCHIVAAACLKAARDHPAHSHTVCVAFLFWLARQHGRHGSFEGSRG